MVKRQTTYCQPLLPYFLKKLSKRKKYPETFSSSDVPLEIDPHFL